HDVVHFIELLGRRTDDEVGPFCDDVQFVVGDDRRDLDDDVVCWVESGHLEIHPGEHRGASYPDPAQLYYGALSWSTLHWFSSTWTFRRHAVRGSVTRAATWSPEPTRSSHLPVVAQQSRPGSRSRSPRAMRASCSRGAGSPPSTESPASTRRA